jgi:adenosylcobinamide-phosphate synthase
LSYALHLPATLIVCAVALDAACGDPDWLPHPVKAIGWMIARGEGLLYTGQSRRDLLSGGVLCIGIITSAGVTAWLIIAVAEKLNLYAGALISLLMGWTMLAARGLDDAARSVEYHLRSDDEVSARCAIRALVGRDSERLDRNDLLREAIESIAENCNDGFVAPLLFLVVAGPVGAVIYKAINTLGSMIGYRSTRYLYFGRVSARLDDAANFIPAHFAALAIGFAAAFVTGRAKESIRTCRFDGHKHESPNSGYPEAAMAGALGIELGGDAFYDGELEHRPRLGVACKPLDLDTLRSARFIMWTACGIALVVMLALRGALSRI